MPLLKKDYGNRNDLFSFHLPKSNTKGFLCDIKSEILGLSRSLGAPEVVYVKLVVCTYTVLNGSPHKDISGSYPWYL